MRGYIVVGDAVSRSVIGHTAQAAVEVFISGDTVFEIVQNVTDVIPDVRRTRRDCRGVKGENIIVLRKVK